MKTMFDMWKKGFDAWENVTAQYIENWLKSPLVLKPSGKVLSKAMKAKATRDEVIASWWKHLGLPTRRDQERALHVLNQLQSHVHDLEERLEQAQNQSKQN
jgi:hypothetical protein